MKIGIGVHLEDNQIEWHAEQIGHDAQELFWERHAEFFTVVEQRRDEVGKEEANQDEDGERRRKQTRQSVNDYEEVEAAQDNRDGNQSPLHFRVVQAFPMPKEMRTSTMQERRMRFSKMLAIQKGVSALFISSLFCTKNLKKDEIVPQKSPVDTNPIA